MSYLYCDWYIWLILSIVWWIRSFYSFLSVSLFFVFWLLVVVSSCIICSSNEDYIKITKQTGYYPSDESFSILSSSFTLFSSPKFSSSYSLPCYYGNGDLKELSMILREFIFIFHTILSFHSIHIHILQITINNSFQNTLIFHTII